MKSRLHSESLRTAAPVHQPRHRLWSALVLLTGLLGAGAALAAVEGAKVGQPAPGFEMTDTKGQPRSLAEMKGKVVVLEWANFECPYTRKHYDSGNMQALQREAAEAGAEWLVVISSAPGEEGHVSAEEANRLIAERDGAPAAVLLDEEGTLGRLYGAKTTPHMYVVDKDGVLAYMGGIDSIASARVEDVSAAEPWFGDALRAVLKGEEPARAVTRPYGCSVKYAR
ncbi:redoxin domain-containing protein [Thiorhodococcus mannitoliphagus]|uniref:Redoxin domain-containing protein n=2 Tax=Thiorhodococcus mannitoliphagus TaxID=329406 RepID=A0A6P1E0D1_9GAMM|nr:redoxin domain-containing protein [Thiorhodococcus mannitoliphagus]